MSTLFKKLSKISNKDKDTVNGYIKEIENVLNLQHIPTMISSMIILFFHDDEVFDIVGKNIKLSDDEKSIIKGRVPGLALSSSSSYSACNNYGIIEISSSSSSKNSLIYKWDLKIHKVGKKSCSVGVSSVITPNLTAGIAGYNYFYYSNGYLVDRDQLNRDIPKYKDGDKISIILNLRDATVLFLANDIDQGIAYKNIKKGDGFVYRLTVSMPCPDNHIEIINFEKY